MTDMISREAAVAAAASCPDSHWGPWVAERIRALPAVQTKTDDFFFALPVTLTYTNWRGEKTQRTIVPRRVWFGSNDWHPNPQWLLTALDTEKGEERDFALKDFGNPAVQPKVKPLVWYGKPADFYMFADTAFGLYEIGVEHGDEWFSDFTDHKSGKPVRLSSWQDGSIVPQDAAQADYEARILSALEPAVQPDADAIKSAAFEIAVLMEIHAATSSTTKAKAEDIERGIRALIDIPRKDISHE